jgi:hypothetical protein
MMTRPGVIGLLALSNFVGASMPGDCECGL